MEYNGMKWVFEELRYWVEKLSEWQRQPEENEQAALTGFLDALNETTIYLGRIRVKPHSSTRDDEERLSRLWRSAAQLVREYNPELAQRCIAKGTYWADPHRWTSEQIEEMKISIEEISGYANRALASA